MNLRSRPSVPKPPAIMRFLWFCSGAHPEVLAACPRSEHAKFTGIGGTVFFTGLLATLSGGYAFFTVFEHLGAAVAFGALWGLIIFNLDRYIVSTLKKEGPFSRQLTLAIPRFLLAISLAIVIAKPLELRIFQEEINEVLTERQRTKGEAAGAAILDRRQVLEERIGQLERQTEAALQRREQDYQDYKCECDGTCGTGKRGRGSECARKEQKYLATDREYREMKLQNDGAREAIRAQIEELEATARLATEEAEAAVSRGLLARLSASGELPAGPGLFIILLFILIEVSPLLTKLLAPRGPYDELLARIEHEFYLEQLRRIEVEKLAMNKEIAKHHELHNVEIAEEVRQKQEAMRAMADARMEIVQDQIDAWLAEERMRKLREGSASEHPS
ncbi:DUF4407 domain-containing protein [Lewinella sp. W8]|uniref:DUF4407 domain-containing protein n=1 Tax=Lewinella sp. W8 TaxID=2528208 RepID=UPI0015645569|nr:DUF4407 domain-containing protein [Lewinella sp. W8]